MPMSREADDTLFDHALQEERIRNARRATLMRAVLVSGFAINNLSWQLGIYGAGWGTLQSVMMFYCVFAWLVWAGSRFSGRVALVSSLAIPLLDMPVVAYLTHLGARSDLALLAPVEYSHGQAGVFCLLLVIAMFTLRVRYMVFTAVMAMGLETLFFVNYKQNLQGQDLAFSLLLIGSVSLVTLYARRRIIALVADISEQRERRARMQRFFSPEVARVIEDAGGDGEGENHEVTVLVSDLRGFTALSKTMSSEQVVEMLNGYLTEMVDLIFEHGGTLDKFMGDGILAYFGAPINQPDHADRALRCALDMQGALAEFNVAGLPRVRKPLRMGIGLHSGSVTLGAIGPPSRREYTIIGETVNLAARLEQATKSYGTDIILSRATVEALTGARAVEALPPATVRGVSEPVPVYAPRVAARQGQVRDVPG